MMALRVIASVGVLVLATLLAEAAPMDADQTSVTIAFDAEKEPETAGEGAFPYAPPIEQIFQNPAIATGIASGADAINRSVESLMDALFYSLLDNERNFYLTDEAWFNTTLWRDVYSTPSGAYVVMDRFKLGPRYAKELWRLHDVPITLGIDGTVEVLQIYLRSDGMRLAEQDELSPTRRWINNWFGLLPLASAVLPPSFNQNELYDPVTQLKTPFSFPLEVDDFYDMPVGSIRSYAISGGVQIGADLGAAKGQDARDTLDRVGGLAGAIPYSIFVRGEHRINVLRRDEHSAWVGVKELKRFGHSISPLLGAKYFVFSGALAARLFDWDWVWGGVPLAVLPLDMSVEQAAADLFDQVYEYDLRAPEARDAYEAAVKGDFLVSRMRYLDKKERGLATGVTFHFARNQDRNEELSRNGPNLAVYKRERKRDHGAAEVEITDSEGKFFVLESSLDIEDKSWDVLVGDEESRILQGVEMKVRRVVPSATSGSGELPKTESAVKGGPEDASAGEGDGDPDGFTYAFEADPDPYRLTIALNIQDRYVDTAEYYQYLDELRFFSGLPLTEAPHLGLRDDERVEERRRVSYFVEPTREVTNVHVTPTYLGRLGAQASISLSAKQLERIVTAPEARIWAAFAYAYGKNIDDWARGEYRASFSHQVSWFGSFFLFPTRLLNIRIPGADAIKEATNAVTQVLALKGADTPIEKLDAFNKLLDTDYPRHLARALLELADLDHVPRRVTFSAQPKGAARHEIKAAFGRLNGAVFKAGPPFPESTRYARAKAKLANFYLDQPRQEASKPRITGIEVHTRPIPESVRSLADEAQEGKSRFDRDQKHVFITVKTTGTAKEGPAKIYVRVEQAGRIKIGKLELAEKVLELTPLEEAADPGEARSFEFYLTGPLSPLSNYLLDEFVGSGDDFLVTLATSRSGAVWSDERSLEFRFENGRLTPPK